MNVTPRILLLTAGFGNGHVQASRAIQEQFQKQGVQQVITLDLMKESHPLLNTIMISLYNKSTQISRMGIDYYGWTYYLTRESEYDALINRTMNQLGRKKLVQIIEQERPDAVVSTFPFGSAPEICRSMGIHNVTVLTDYALHSRWIHPKVDKYYVATEELRQQLADKGFSREQITVSGIPIRQQFCDMEAAPFPEHASGRTILVMAGDAGISAYMGDMISALLTVGEAEHVTVICGRNDRLKQRLAAQFPSHPRLSVIGYVNNIHEFMASAACIVTKAGGLTLTEAISMRLPIFIFKPYAGQERENAVYLSERGAAFISNHVEELAAQIEWLLGSKARYEETKKCMAAFKTRRAAAAIVDDIIQTIAQPVSLTV
ncbi:MGDG synthase family glycosyltransferase [Paenibacillus sp. y28]|uniref:MGDG synthase family glycosyltransferase n=1 Tax=Paenibacillus sp. y28 TaxID=3129110 RepID=UPI003015A6AB